MKRFMILLLTFVVAFSLALPAYASAGEGESSSGTTVIEVALPEDDLGTYIGSSVSTYASYSSGSSADLKSVLIQFLGEWETVVVEHTYQASDGSINTVQKTQPDYPWLCAAALLCIMIFCLFRLGGSILCKT